MKYSEERKKAVLSKLLPRHNRTVTELLRDEGPSTAMLYKWRNDAREQARLLPEASTEPDGWSSQDKFSAVRETAALNDTETGQYCRCHGL